MLDSLPFYLFATVAILSAALMITRRNAIHSAVFFAITLLSTAGIFLHLYAEFLFIIQVILSVGAIVTLFLLVIVFVGADSPVPRRSVRAKQLVAALVSVALGLELAVLLLLTRKLPGQGLFVLGIAPAEKLPQNSEALAASLFSDYLLPFEMVSVLLLVAMIGAVVMVKNRKRDAT
jgi:NADH-quinone oxidoreductase subunit J